MSIVSKKKKIVNAIFAFLIVGVSMGTYQSPAAFLVSASVLVLGSAVINLTALRSDPGRHRRSFRLLLLSPLMLIGLFGVSLATSSLPVKLVLAAAVAALLYFYEAYFPEEMPKEGEETAVLLTAALLFGFVWAVNFYFTPPWYAVLLLTFVLFFALGAYALGARNGLLASLIILEIQWALLYWPTHYLTTAAVNFAAFYLIYVLSRLEARKRLSVRQLYFQAATVAVVLALILGSSPWRP